MAADAGASGAVAPPVAPPVAPESGVIVAEAPRPPSHRIRTCVEGVSRFVTNLLAPIMPEPPPPEPRVRLDKDGNKLGPDGKPVRLPRKERLAEEEKKKEMTAVDELMAIGINPKKDPIMKNMSNTRLKQFVDALDGVKRHIYKKAPQIASKQAMKLVEECGQTTLMTVALPWGPKKGNNQTAAVKLKVKDPPYDPNEKGPRAGTLLLVVETEGNVKSVAITAVSANTGSDNVVSLTCGKDGQLLLTLTDEPSRWKWFLAINAGLHRVSAIRCMLDQAACTMPWHPACTAEAGAFPSALSGLRMLSSDSPDCHTIT